jgi:hypothetical protein
MTDCVTETQCFELDFQHRRWTKSKGKTTPDVTHNRQLVAALSALIQLYDTCNLFQLSLHFYIQLNKAQPRILIQP